MNLRVALLGFSALAIACGGSPTGPSGGGGGGGGGGGAGGGGPVQTTTITITSAGVSPRQIIVSAGARVTFINQDSRPHEMNSDPHPTHGDCPAIDDVGFIASGQTKLTGNLNVVRTCGYHDHQQDQNTTLQGQIIIQ